MQYEGDRQTPGEGLVISTARLSSGCVITSKAIFGRADPSYCHVSISLADKRVRRSDGDEAYQRLYPDNF